MQILDIPVADIAPHPRNPRRAVGDVTELAASMRENGLIEPVVVVIRDAAGKKKAARYTLIAGERRWRAAGLAKLTHIPAIVRTGKELERLEVALLENVQRVDLSPLEQAISIERWHQQFNVAYDTIAQRLGKAPSTINNIVRLLQLPELAREALDSHKISEGHARAILALKDHPQQQSHLLESIIANDWSVRQAERYVSGVKAGASDTQAAKARVDTETPATKALSKRIGTAVTIKRTAHGGKLELAFKSDEDLDKLLNRLNNL